MSTLEPPRRRRVHRVEQERILRRWSETGVSAKEMARQTGVSPASLFRWKHGVRQRSTATVRGPAMVEVPAPVGGVGVAEVMTRGGPVRLFAAATPAWAAQLIRELNRC